MSMGPSRCLRLIWPVASLRHILCAGEGMDTGSVLIESTFPHVIEVVAVSSAIFASLPCYRTSCWIVTSRLEFEERGTRCSTRRDSQGRLCRQAKISNRDARSLLCLGLFSNLKRSASFQHPTHDISGKMQAGGQTPVFVMSAYITSQSIQRGLMVSRRHCARTAVGTKSTDLKHHCCQGQIHVGIHHLTQYSHEGA